MSWHKRENFPFPLFKTYFIIEAFASVSEDDETETGTVVTPAIVANAGGTGETCMSVALKEESSIWIVVVVAAVDNCVAVAVDYGVVVAVDNGVVVAVKNCVVVAVDNCVVSTVGLIGGIIFVFASLLISLPKFKYSSQLIVLKYSSKFLRSENESKSESSTNFFLFDIFCI